MTDTSVDTDTAKIETEVSKSELITPLGLHWQNKPPEVTGWYWWRGLLPDRAGTFMVHVEGPENCLEMFVFTPLMQTKIYGIDAGMKSEWAGPILPPEP